MQDGNGRMGSLDPPQEQALLRMREAWKGLPFGCTDEVLLRFLRVNDWDVEVAQKRARHTMDWRAAYGCDALLYEWSIADVLDGPEEYSQFKACYETMYHRTDRWGRPVLIHRIGVADFEGLRDLVTEADSPFPVSFMLYHVTVRTCR